MQARLNQGEVGGDQILVSHQNRQAGLAIEAIGAWALPAIQRDPRRGFWRQGVFDPLDVGFSLGGIIGQPDYPGRQAVRGS